MNPLLFVVFIVCFLSSIVGSICGIGGGVIIKPVLDAMGIMSVSSVSFLSGCTVLSMSVVSLYKNMKEGSSKLNLKASSILAIGAVLGGIFGKMLFQSLKLWLNNEALVGRTQAIVLLLITAGTLLYTLFKGKIKTKNWDNIGIYIIIGLLLGLMSSFLGIGGGPINLVVLVYYFSMGTKEAALNSIYIIMFSQVASLIQVIAAGNLPPVNITYFVVMVIGGILGGTAGSALNCRIKERRVNQLFIGVMSVIILINIYNIWRFSL